MTKDELEAKFEEAFPNFSKSGMIKRTFQTDDQTLKIHTESGKVIYFVASEDGIHLESR